MSKSKNILDITNDTLIRTKTWVPELNSMKWKKNQHYYRYVEDPKLELIISDEVIDEAKSYNPINNDNKTNENSIFTYIEYTDGIKKIVSYSRRSFLRNNFNGFIL
jgi:hypothetical protein